MTPAGPIGPERPGPTDNSDALTQREFQKAAVWLGLAAALALLWYLAQPILLVVAALVLAAMLDGGARLLGRVLPLPRGGRLGIVCVGVLGFTIWTGYFAGSSIVGQFEMLQRTVTQQGTRLLGWVNSLGLLQGNDQINQIGKQLMSSLGELTSAVGTAFGVISSVAMVLVLGLFLAGEPRLYERGFAWMLPMQRRARFYQTASRMGFTMRRLMAGRLLGMGVEGVGTWLLLWLGGVPMAGLLGLLTGLLAFLPISVRSSPAC
jgi:predicted PurR-regulated permease PerM